MSHDGTKLFNCFGDVLCFKSLHNPPRIVKAFIPILQNSLQISAHSLKTNQYDDFSFWQQQNWCVVALRPLFQAGWQRPANSEARLPLCNHVHDKSVHQAGHITLVLLGGSQWPAAILSQPSHFIPPPADAASPTKLAFLLGLAENFWCKARIFLTKHGRTGEKWFWRLFFFCCRILFLFKSSV